MENDHALAGLDSLFAPRPEDMVLKEYRFGQDEGTENVDVSIFASTAASTDYDLTGIIVWPISILLAHYMFHVRETVKGARVLEIGAGCGLAGLLAARLGPVECIISDGEELVVNIIEKNVKLLKSPSLETTRAALLRWGDPENLQAFKQAFGDNFDLAFGADIFHASFGEPLEVFQLLDNLNIQQFLCGYVERKNREAVFQAAKTANWTWQSVAPNDFLPQHVTADLLSTRSLEMYVFSK